jgi:hypothetical protein
VLAVTSPAHGFVARTLLVSTRFCTVADVGTRTSLLSDPVALARRFHEVYEELAPTFGYETRRESAVAWEDVPQANRHLMIAVAAVIQREATDD